jgi:hypothetical protein
MTDVTLKNLDEDKILLVGKYRQYTPSSVDMTKAEQVAEIVKKIADEASDNASMKEAKRLATITPSDIEVQVAV